jgi:hypothetical protein
LLDERAVAEQLFKSNLGSRRSTCNQNLFPPIALQSNQPVTSWRRN